MLIWWHYYPHRSIFIPNNGSKESKLICVPCQNVKRLSFYKIVIEFESIKNAYNFFKVRDCINFDSNKTETFKCNDIQALNYFTSGIHLSCVTIVD